MIAVIALHLAFARLLLQNDPLFGFCTYYSERYSESRFNTIRVGMSGAEVEAIIGPPLRKQRWNEHAGQRNEEMWEYSGAAMRRRISGGGGCSSKMARFRGSSAISGLID